MFAKAYMGPKMGSSNAFTSGARVLDPGRCLCAHIPKALGGLRPSFSAHVRFREHGAPVQFPADFATTQTPKGRLKMGRDAILDNFHAVPAGLNHVARYTQD